MAPITATSIGVTPQVVDDPRLLQLLERLNSIHVGSADSDVPPLDIDDLVSELAKFPKWRFEEQADLYYWINPLNAIDASLSYLMKKYPALLLIGPMKVTKKAEGSDMDIESLACQAESPSDVEAVPTSVVTAVCTLLRFLSCLLSNSFSKSVFNSVDELTLLLAASHDDVAACALEALCSLATPPSLHKQQSPEVHHHTSALHSSTSGVHNRLLTMARGWGSRGSGLGLYACVTADDSEYGQGSLPAEAGELAFEFFPSSSTAKDETSGTDGAPPTNGLVRIHLSAQDIVDEHLSRDGSSETSDTIDEVTVSKQKRRRMDGSRRRGMKTKPTCELFFHCLKQIGGRDRISRDKLFTLLFDIRLAKAFHSNASRIRAVECRLRALTTILHSHPSQDIMSGYFHAQPELCIELIDLLRPTVSSASVSAAAARPTKSAARTKDGDLVAIAALAHSPEVPYTTRTLAVEALTALVARRDASTGGMLGLARQSSVLSELGVAKGQYLGLLPTLIRYSLASLSSFLTENGSLDAAAKNEIDTSDAMDVDDESLPLKIGLAFLEATKPPSLARHEQLERALEFIDVVLTLSSAVVSAPSGTAALTDCGLIPALLSTVAIESSILEGTDMAEDTLSRSACLLRCITAQAIQILEGAIVTHNNALSAFHDLHGVDILISRLHREIEEVRSDGECPEDMDTSDGGEDRKVRSAGSPGRRSLTSARRVLLFSIVNCLTVVFHQESSSSSPSAPAAGTQLRKPELTRALIDILENVSSYGGMLAALVSSLLSDVMNSDPLVVRHVHESGLANSFLKMIMVKENNSTLPPIPELIMALPNVISALSLTEDGANAVREADPFPSLLSVFYQPEYAMPQSRCLLSELTAIVGTGIDEIMRHVPSLRPLVLSAIVKAMREVFEFGSNLIAEEEAVDISDKNTTNALSLETKRTCLMQYALNFGQMLEQILHNEDHCKPFVEAGGLDELLKWHPLLMPSSFQFLANASCLSCPSICTLAHSSTEDSITIAVKSISAHYDSKKMLKKIINALSAHMSDLEESENELREGLSVNGVAENANASNLGAYGVLNGVPEEPIHALSDSDETSRTTKLVSKYLRHVVTLQWLTNLLASVIKSAWQRSQESGTGWGRGELEWRNTLSSSSFADLIERVSLFHYSALLETCRIRTAKNFELREKDRLRPGPRRLRFRLRIVCQEGAVVRDGIEIDSSPSVGLGLEMGEIVDAFDRCVNTNGVLRYRTKRGWISELTRGHGREPIAEVIRVWRCDEEGSTNDVEDVAANNKRTECGILGLASAGASVLARMQTSHSDLFSSLSRVAIQGVRSLQPRSISFRKETPGAHAAALVQLVSSNIEKAFSIHPVRDHISRSLSNGKSEESFPDSISASGASMYLGCMLSLLHACLFSEKREKRLDNVPLLMFMMKSDQEDSQTESSVSFISAVRFVLGQCLVDLSNAESSPAKDRVTVVSQGNEEGIMNSRHHTVVRSVASSLPPTLALLNRLMSPSLLSNSPTTPILSRLKGKDLEELVGQACYLSVIELDTTKDTEDDCGFRPEPFLKALHCTVAEMTLKIWIDPRLTCFPPHIIHPFAVLVGSIIAALEQASKKPTVTDGSGEASRSWDLFSRRVPAQVRRQLHSNHARETQFEPSEEAVSRLMEMGFGREHALEAFENTGTNRFEIAMEYALSHRPPSPATIERRRAARAERDRQRREREEQQGVVESASDSQDNSGSGAVDGDTSDNEQPEASRSTADDMDVDEESPDAEQSSSKSKEGSKEEAKDLTRERAKDCLRSWIEHSSEVSLNILSGSFEKDGQVETTPYVDDGTGSGDGEVEAVTVVLSSFLLDLCQGYPEERPKVVLQLLQRLKSQLTETCNGGTSKCNVIDGHERAFASFCHAAVLFMRALPKSRVTLLQQGLVQPLVLSLQTFISEVERNNEGIGETSSGISASRISWPMWLAPVLLLLDVMAQPIAAFADSDSDTVMDEGDGGELAQVRQEHKNHAALLSSMANDIFSAIKKTPPCTSENHEVEKTSVDGKEENEATHKHRNAEGSAPSSPFASVPPYFPLLPAEQTEGCMELCLRLLGKGRSKPYVTNDIPPPPGITHASLLLLSHLLRSPKLAAQGLCMGAAETVLNLPRGCRFTGSTGLVTVVLRRLLEDEPTLQATMETEIRATITKLHGKKQSTSRTGEKPNISCHSFVKAVTPMICRDPVTFLKAAASSVSFEAKADSSSDRQPRIELLTPEERTKNVKALSELFGHRASSHAPSGGKNSLQTGTASSTNHRRGKSSNSARMASSKNKSSRGVTTRKGRREKSDDPMSSKKRVVLNGTPTNHVTSLLVSRLMALYQESDDPATSEDCSNLFGEGTSFVWIADILEILADLVLALPTCAAAIHRYRPHGKDRWPRNHPMSNLQHALSGCPNAPKTVVSFLLHRLLPQDRWSPQKVYRRNANVENSDVELSKRKTIYLKSKVSQTSARLFVTLVARAGEGRRRVIADLTFALSGGRIGCSSPPPAPSSTSVKVESVEHELLALHAWGELCIGLAAPRSNGVMNENNSSLSYEMVKLMLESGMVHALLYGIHRVELQHPMAATVCASLLVPLEVFSRGSLTDAIQSLADKEAKERKETPKHDEGETNSKGVKKKKPAEPELDRATSQQSESAFADDAMLEDGFDADTAARTSANAAPENVEQMEDVAYEDEDIEDTMEEYEDESEENDVQGDAESEDEVGSSSDENSIEESSSGEESNDEMDEQESTNSTDDDGDAESDDNTSSDEVDDGEDDAVFDDEYNGDFLDNSDGALDDRPFEADLDGDWTRVDSSGLGGLLIGGRHEPRGALPSRARGWMDAAQAMIGTLLRTGDLEGNAIAEIEDSLGIRLTGNQGSEVGEDRGGSMSNWDHPTGPRNDAATERNRDGLMIGTVPNVNQRNPPDVGYSTLGDASREISSMEYVFAGPSISGGSRNYDVVSPRTVDQVEDFPSPSSGESQLFPGGPAAATHSRTRQSPHPLLRGVNLPPVNSLVSDLLPHGVQATRRDHSYARSTGDWSAPSTTGSYLVTTSGSGNMSVRVVNRLQSSRIPDFSSRPNLNGPSGWADGFLDDGAVGEFSEAFERALGEAMASPEESHSSSNADSATADGEQGASTSRQDDPSANQGAETSTSEQVDSTASGDNAAVQEGNPAGSNHPNSATTANSDPADVSQQSTANTNVDAAETSEHNAEGSSATSEGDGVASSLAAGLRLSPRSESGSDQMSTGNAATDQNAGPESGTSSGVESRPPVNNDVSSTSGIPGGETAGSQAASIAESNPRENDSGEEESSPSNDAPQASSERQNEPNENGLVCPPGIDLDVFNTLPLELQQEQVEQHRVATELASQLDSSSGLDPEVLAAIPEEMRREVIEQEQQERRLREQPPADPSNAEEMDNASFVASLSPELREEILLTADETFLSSLPPNIVAEANVLRERASARSRRFHEEDMFARSSRGAASRGGSRQDGQAGTAAGATSGDQGRNGGSSRKRQRSGKLCVEKDRSQIVYVAATGTRRIGSPFGVADLKALIKLMYLLSPVRPQRLLQKVIRNLCANEGIRCALSGSMVRLLNDDSSGASVTIDRVEKDYLEGDEWRRKMDHEFLTTISDFPPTTLIGAAPEVHDTDSVSSNFHNMLRRRQGSSTAASIASNLPASARGSSRDRGLPTVVATRIIETLSHLSKNSLRFNVALLTNEVVPKLQIVDQESGTTGFDKLLDLLEKPLYYKSSSNLEQLLSLLESAVSPLSHVPKDGEDSQDVSQREQQVAASSGKEWVEVPRVAVSQSRLQLLCSILRMESCRDTSFVKVNTIARRLCRVEANRGCILAELASVAQALGTDAVMDLKALHIRMDEAVKLHQKQLSAAANGEGENSIAKIIPGDVVQKGGASSSVALSTSSSELKLLRVLQTLQGLCIDVSQDDQGGRKNGGIIVTEELVELLQGINLDDLWRQLTSCLEVVQVLEGVASLDDTEKLNADEERPVDMDEDESNGESRSRGKKLQNSVAGLLTRFLPTIEAFFVTNASMTRSTTPDMQNGAEVSSPSKTDESHSESPSLIHGDASKSDSPTDLDALVGGRRVIEFVVANRVLLNALIRNNPGLLEKGLRAMVQVSRCRAFLDFDVKRQWFKTQVRRLRQHASRRHGSLRLSIRRKYVFQDAYDQLRIRNADEMRGRLHITFRNEEGVDAGGLSREFFGILAKEMFNPNYALFTSTEDGCTFQPNPNSSINPDHHSYFRFVGRIVGKAVSDGYLLDAHFTRSLYKHMLGLKPTHDDMEAIDPDYYKNLKTILEYNLADLGLDLTFSIEDHSFGKSQIIDLIPDGRRIAVTEETKAKYVRLVCHHRMTTAIQSQIKAYLDGFYELVSRDLIAIFTPRELELLVSGLPDIDVHDLKKNTEYQGYKAADKEIGWFWNIMFSLSRNEKASFLQFVTGSSKVPLSGFSELQGMRGIQKFTIHKAGGSSGALMSAHTCFNSLDLPVYKSESEMREKLLYAISEGGGAFLFA